MPQNVIVTPPFRNWWEVFLLGLSLMSGAGTIAEPRTLLPYLERALEPGILAAWSWSLVAGAGIALAGLLFWKPSVMSALVERVGLILLGSASAAYPVFLLLVFGDNPVAYQRIVPLVLFSVLVWWRVRKITWALHVLGAPPLLELLGFKRGAR